MANRPLILSDNLFDDTVLHPTHVVTQNLTEVAGSELYHIADNLRDLTRATWQQAGVASYIIAVDCGVPKAASATVLDRGHNLGGIRVVTECSDDNVTWILPFIADATLPTLAGGLPSDPNGCLTPDGVWWRTYAPQSHRYWRIVITNIPAGFTPIITGLYLGAAYRFPEYLDAPGAYDYRTNHKIGKNALSVGGVRVKRRILNFSEVNLALTLEDADYAAFDAQVRNLLQYGQPWWFCLDDSTAAGAGMMRLYQLPGDTVYDPVVDPVHRTVSLLLEEVIPTLTI